MVGEGEGGSCLLQGDVMAPPVEVLARHRHARSGEEDAVVEALHRLPREHKGHCG